jgi:hypothetical protein
MLQKIGLCDRADHLPRELSATAAAGFACGDGEPTSFADEPCANQIQLWFDLFREK